jgi:hypothetical protein
MDERRAIKALLRPQTPELGVLGQFASVSGSGVSAQLALGIICYFHATGLLSATVPRRSARIRLSAGTPPSRSAR